MRQSYLTTLHKTVNFFSWNAVVHKYYNPIAATVFILTLILIGIKNNLQNVMKDDGHYTPYKRSTHPVRTESSQTML